jgi:hypothetical protein
MTDWSDWSAPRDQSVIGICFLGNRWMRVAAWLLAVQLVGILSPVAVVAGRLFSGPHNAPTLEGQYVVKDIVLVAGGSHPIRRGLCHRLGTTEATVAGHPPTWRRIGVQRVVQRQRAPPQATVCSARRTEAASESRRLSAVRDAMCTRRRRFRSGLTRTGRHETKRYFDPNFGGAPDIYWSGSSAQLSVPRVRPTVP